MSTQQSIIEKSEQSLKTSEAWVNSSNQVSAMNVKHHDKMVTSNRPLKTQQSKPGKLNTGESNFTKLNDPDHPSMKEFSDAQKVKQNIMIDNFRTSNASTNITNKKDDSAVPIQLTSQPSSPKINGKKK